MTNTEDGEKTNFLEECLFFFYDESIPLSFFDKKNTDMSLIIKFLDKINEKTKKIYEYESIFSLEWMLFLSDEEKRLYENNSEFYKKKNFLLFRIEIFFIFFQYLSKNIKDLYPIQWKDRKLNFSYFYDTTLKIKINIQINELLSNLRSLRQYYQTNFEKERIQKMNKFLKELKEQIRLRMIPMESYMKIFYKSDFQKINSYDIRREIFQYL